MDLKIKVNILRRRFLIFKIAGLLVISALFFVVVYFDLKSDLKKSSHYKVNLMLAYSVNPIGLFLVLCALIYALIRIRKIVGQFEFSELNRGYMFWHVLFILLIAALSLAEWVYL